MTTPEEVAGSIHASFMTKGVASAYRERDIPRMYDDCEGTGAFQIHLSEIRMTINQLMRSFPDKFMSCGPESWKARLDEKARIVADTITEGGGGKKRVKSRGGGGGGPSRGGRGGFVHRPSHPNPPFKHQFHNPPRGPSRSHASSFRPVRPAPIQHPPPPQMRPLRRPDNYNDNRDGNRQQPAFRSNAQFPVHVELDSRSPSPRSHHENHNYHNYDNFDRRAPSPSWSYRRSPIPAAPRDFPSHSSRAENWNENRRPEDRRRFDERPTSSHYNDWQRHRSSSPPPRADSRSSNGSGFSQFSDNDGPAVSSAKMRSQDRAGTSSDPTRSVEHLSERFNAVHVAQEPIAVDQVDVQIANAFPRAMEQFREQPAFIRDVIAAIEKEIRRGVPGDTYMERRQYLESLKKKLPDLLRNLHFKDETATWSASGAPNSQIHPGYVEDRLHNQTLPGSFRYASDGNRKEVVVTRKQETGPARFQAALEHKIFEKSPFVDYLSVEMARFLKFDKFSVRSTSDEADFEKMDQAIQMSATDLKDVPEIPAEQWKTFHACLVKVKDVKMGTRWRRGIVLKREDDVRNGTIVQEYLRVYLLDYGYSLLATPSQLRVMPVKFSDTRPFAIPCVLDATRDDYLDLDSAQWKERFAESHGKIAIAVTGTGLEQDGIKTFKVKLFVQSLRGKMEDILESL